MHLAQKCLIRNCMKGIRKACPNSNDLTSTSCLIASKVGLMEWPLLYALTSGWSEAVSVWKFTICCRDTLSYFYTFENVDIYLRFDTYWMGLMRVIFQRFGKFSFKMYAVRGTPLQRIRSKPLNKPMPLLLANYHKGSDAFSCKKQSACAIHPDLLYWQMNRV